MVHVPANVSIYQEANDGAVARAYTTKKPDLAIILDQRQSTWGQVLIFFDGEYWRANSEDLFIVDHIDST